MAVTQINTKNVNKIEPTKVKIVNTIPELRDTEMGEVYLLIADSATDDKKLHIRVAAGWLKSAALT